MALRCPECKLEVKDDDMVVLDETNTINHRNCYKYPVKYIKDIGTYREIIHKYLSFRELRTK